MRYRIYLFFCVLYTTVLCAEPVNSFSVSRDLHNSGTLVVNQSINGNYKSDNEVRIKVDKDYRGERSTIQFTSFSSSERSIVKCNNKELILNPNTSYSIIITAELDGYSKYYSRKSDSEININFEKFICKCVNCTFMKE